MYPACNAHAPYCHLWLSGLYSIFPHYLINGTIFEKMLLNTKCVFWVSLQLLSEISFILRRNERDMIKYVYWCLCKVAVIIVRFERNLNFFTDFIKNTQISNFMKIRPVGAELFHADGWTDMKKLIVTFRNFCDCALKRGTVWNLIVVSVKLEGVKNYYIRLSLHIYF